MHLFALRALVVLVTLITATQTYAHLKAYAPALHPQEIVWIAGYRVYRPWGLFSWLYDQPSLLFETEMSIAIGGLGLFLGLGFGVIRKVQGPTPLNSHGSSRWASAKEIRRMGL